MKTYLLSIALIIATMQATFCQNLVSQFKGKRDETFNAIAISDDGNSLYSTSYRVVKWDIGRGRYEGEIEPFEITGPSYSAKSLIKDVATLDAFNAQVTTLSGYYATIDTENRKLFHKSQVDGKILDVRKSANQRKLLIATTKAFYHIDLFDDSKSHEVSHSHKAEVGCYISTDDGIVLGSKKGELFLVDTQTGEKVKTFDGHGKSIKAISMNPDKKSFASMTTSDVKVWDLQSLAQVAETDSPFSGLKVFLEPDMVYSPDGYYLVVNLAEKIYFLNSQSLNTVTEFSDPNYEVNDMAFDPSFQYFYTCGRQGEDQPALINKYDVSSLSPFTLFRSWSFKNLDRAIQADPVGLSQEIRAKFVEDKSFFSEKGEFESSEAYDLRRQSQKEFLSFLYSKYSDVGVSEMKELIRKSYFESSTKNVRLESYDADNQSYLITVDGYTENAEMVPQEAKQLRDNLRQTEFICERQLSDDGLWKLLNVKFLHPVTKRLYYVGPKRTPLYHDVSVGLKAGLPELAAEISLREPSGNNRLDGGESAHIVVKINNTGQGVASNIRVKSELVSSDGINLKKEARLQSLSPGTSHEVLLPIEASLAVSEQDAMVKISFEEANGFVPPPVNIKFKVQPFVAPKLVLRGVSITEKQGNGNKIIENNELVEVSVLFQNVGQGNAENVIAEIIIRNEDIVPIDSKKLRLAIPKVAPGESKTFSFSIAVNSNYSGSNTLPIDLYLSESNQKFGGTFPLELSMSKRMLTAKIIEVEGTDTPEKDIQVVNFKEFRSKEVSYDLDANTYQIEPEKRINNQKRIALVIGNNSYKFNASLRNAKSDADLMAETLSQIGFEVTVAHNVDNERFRSLIRKFSLDRLNADVTFFFFAGHGMQVDNHNYLVPTDAEFANGKSDLAFQTINVELLTERTDMLNKDALNIIVLDACRNNPFKTWTRGGETGLAEVVPPSGTVVAYATSPNSLASDGDGKNGLYTGELAKQLIKNQRVEDVFINTRLMVERKSSNKQSPWELSRLRGEYFLAN